MGIKKGINQIYIFEKPSSILQLPLQCDAKEEKDLEVFEFDSADGTKAFQVIPKCFDKFNS